MNECETFDFGCHTDNALTAVGEFFNWIWQSILEALLGVLNAIPVPAWMSSGSFSLPDGVLWFASALELDYGASVMASAFLIRFLIRRLPVIG